MSLLRSAVLTAALIFAVAGGGQAAGLADLRGTWRGFAIVVQGKSASGARLALPVTVKVTATARTAKFVVSGEADGKRFTQTIDVRDGRARYSALLPGIAGFQAAGEMSARVAGRRITVNGPIQPSNYRFGGRIELVNAGAMLSIGTQIKLTSGDPVYATVLAY